MPVPLRVLPSSERAIDFNVFELLELLAEQCVALLNVDLATVTVEADDDHPRVVAGAEHLVHDHPVETIPLRLRDSEIGSLSLFSLDGRLLTEGERATAHALADLAAVAIVQHRATTDARFINAKLSRSMGARVLIEQATGVVAEREGLSIDQALVMLRGYARSRRRRLVSVAQEMIRDTLTPSMLASKVDAMAATIDRNVAELRNAAKHDTRLRNRLAAVVAGMSEALVAVDAKGRVTEFNRAAEDLVGCSADMARGKHVSETVRLVSNSGEDLSGHLRIAMTREWNSVASLIPRFGQPLPVAISAGPLVGANDEAAGGLFVIRDLRGERDVDRMKTEFLSHIGHELRTPLSGVIGFTELLSRRRLSPEQSQPIFRDILGSARRLERVVELLEFFAAAGAGQISLTREDIDVREVAKDVVERLAKSAPGQLVDLRVSRSPATASADRRWLTRSLEELVDNAIKFSPDSARVTVSGRVHKDHQRVVLSVRDFGRGLTPDERERVFAPFVQGDGSNTRVGGGFGLGLALVQRVAEAHGGSISLETEIDKGSLFSVLLPIAPTS